MKEKYSEKLKDPRWQKKRLEVFQRDDFVCQGCYDGESSLSVHHLYYDKGLDPWDYPIESLITLCENCHQLEYETTYDTDKKLIRAIRSAGFLNGDIDRIAAGFEQYKLPHASEVTASMIEWLLTNERLQKRLIDAYFSQISKDRKRESQKS